MNQTRGILLFAWIAVAIMIAYQWTLPAESPAQSPAALTGENSEQSSDSQIPGLDTAPQLTIPEASQDNIPSVSQAPSTPELESEKPLIAGRKIVQISTDALRIDVDSMGGNIVGAELLKYPVTLNEDSPNVRLFNREPGTVYMARSGLGTTSGRNAPNHTTLFEVSAENLQLKDDQDAVELVLNWQDPNSSNSVRKIIRLERDSYRVIIRHEIQNNSDTKWSVVSYEDLYRSEPVAKSGGFMFTNPEAFSFTGAAWFTPTEKFEKRSFEDFVEDPPLNRDATDGWIAMLQHHFVSAWIPTAGDVQKFTTSVEKGQHYVIRSTGPAKEIAANSSMTTEHALWVGPKLHEAMDQVHPTLALTLDYGVLSFLSQPLFIVLNWLHGLLGNWGWAIIAIVVLLKIALFWFANKQYKSFARLREVQPRIEALKERYGEDKQKFQMAMMELYKKEKINPVSGCLPMLVPIPIFIALYWVLVESVELRQAPWVLWIDNLTAPDPLFILPVLNLVTMWLTQKLTPSPGMDPMQKKMMQMMPIVFGVMFAFFPSGLVLYWFTNGLLGLAQQYWMTRKHSAKAETVSKS